MYLTGHDVESPTATHQGALKMPKFSIALPKYREHRASSQLVVAFDGRDQYLGPYFTNIVKLEATRSRRELARKAERQVA